jgi:hypothetical protein
MKIAEYECDCGFTWKQSIPKIQPNPPFEFGAANCPACGSLYCKWVNYESLLRSI